MRNLQIPKLTKAQLRDPSLLDPKVRELRKKMRKALESSRSRSLDVLLLYMSVSPYERELILNNFDNLLFVLEEELKKESKKYFGWALVFASFQYRTWKNIYWSAVEPEPVEGQLFPIFKKPQIKMDVPKVDPELNKIYNDRLDSLMGKLRTDLYTGIKMDLDMARLNNWDSKKTQKKIDERFRKAENHASMIARTEMMFVYNSYLIDQARKDGFNFLVWRTAEDELVCSECGPRNNKAYPIDNLPQLPAHPNCRCGWILPLVN